MKYLLHLSTWYRSQPGLFPQHSQTWNLSTFSPRLCLFSCPPLLPLLLTRMSQEEQGPPGANAARPWQCRDLCPFIVCATMTWLAAAGGSPQSCCCLIKRVALGCFDFCSCYRVVFLVPWLSQVMFPPSDPYLPCGFSNSSFCLIYQRYRNSHTLPSGMVI